MSADQISSVNEPWEWNVAVFSHNEAARLGQCIASIAQAIGRRRALVTLVLNGTTDDSAAIAWQAAREHGVPIEIWRIPLGDKSNAIDQFFYQLRVPAELYFSVDGYVTIGRRSFEGLAAALAGRPGAVAATGIAVNGRTMHLSSGDILELGGVLQGQLHALRPEFIDRVVGQGISLPIGLYRGDGLLGAMVAHDLDAVRTQWGIHRVVGVAEATFEIPSLSLLAPRDLRRQFRRKVRQMRGHLENAAIKTVIYRCNFTALPAYADELISTYLSDYGVPPTRLADQPFMRLALRQHRAARRADAANLTAKRVEFPN